MPLWDNNPDNYKNALSKWIDETRTKKYNGENVPTIVLFNPIAQEDLSSANYPTGEKLAEQNARLEKITAITAAVADEKSATTLTLSRSVKHSTPRVKKPLTLNGIFLTQEGNQHLAQHIFKALFDKDAPTKHKNLELIREKVVDKNWHWFNRYRATDGNDVRGGRRPSLRGGPIQ